MFLGILTLLVALCISGIAAYYSIIGLTAIFAAAFLPIVLMGSVLEIGKILSTVWLHQNWHRAPRVIKAYLTIAVVVLMFITSMGVFGFLSKSHIQQSSLGNEQLAQATVIDEKLERSEFKIERWQQEMKRLNAGETSGRIDTLIKRERGRISEAQSNIKPQIDAENAKIPGLREQSKVEIAQQNKRLNDAQGRSQANIVIAQKQIAQLDKDVDAYTGKGVVEGTFNDTDLVARGAKLRREQKPERDALQRTITKSKKDELSVAARVQREITNINKKLASQIKAVDARIATIRLSIAPTVASANENIAKYTSEAGTTNNDIDGKLIEIEKRIEKEQPVIDSIIVAVFDPLAVCLVLAGSMTIGWANKDRRDKKIKSAGIVADRRVGELEMQIGKHNEILEELEKLLDQNIGNIDAADYAQLQTEHAGLSTERSELESALATAKNETELLVDKVVSTEEERDLYKKRIDDLVSGTDSFEKRITELLDNISTLEAEVERRDAVVMKMAEKYQLVEKDEFADTLVTEAAVTPKTRTSSTSKNS